MPTDCRTINSLINNKTVPRTLATRDSFQIEKTIFSTRILKRNEQFINSKLLSYSFFFISYFVQILIGRTKLDPNLMSIVLNFSIFVCFSSKCSIFRSIKVTYRNDSFSKNDRFWTMTKCFGKPGPRGYSATDHNFIMFRKFYDFQRQHKSVAFRNLCLFVL